MGPGLHTVTAAANIHDARADGNKEDTLLLVLGVELAHDQVQGRLGGGVQGAEFHLVLVGQLEIGQARSDGDDLLDLALLD